ncbi:RNaseH domain-containing protein [Bradyrhizobium pachyrhizi]|uniref:RNaseH domain-containing protein n=1 Tax=Bradyrhizobium pachyrhizi TaxID=280333 RepID=UPI0024B121F4|nr:RNaseH domain-containing protein [Bradyrhizobium pachyrhizi]WFU58272.1 RNaseH domain-containing protein [Bradyrhizobium pachyrhizi]
MANVNSLDLNVWEAGFTAQDTLALTRYRLSPDAQETLQAWSREKSKRPNDAPSTLRLDGLSEILAWFVPEIAFMRRHHWDAETQSRPLSFFLIGDVAADEGLRRRVQAAIGLWLTLIYPSKPAPTRAAIAATAMDAASWTKLPVNGALQIQEGACPNPADNLLFDAIAAHALGALAGQDLRFRSGAQRVLVAKAAQTDAFTGVELVAFPPRQTQRGLWSEVITLYTPTYPERPRLHLLARPSIRNWGPVKRWTGRNDPDRALDVFMPAMESASANVYRHTSFDFRARGGPAPAEGGHGPTIGYWPHKDDQKVFDLVRRLTGRAALAPAELAQPVVDEDGLWVLPRLGTVHGDDWLPGGTGISWPDRHDIGDSLNQALSKAGFNAVEPMTRARQVMPLDKPFNSKADDETFASRRRAVRMALTAVGAPTAQVDLFIFQRRDDAPERITSALLDELGAPQAHEAGTLSWSCGLTIRLHPVNAGVLADEVSWAEATTEETKTLNPAQLRSIREMNRSQAFDDAQKAMAAHVAAARAGTTGVGWAILEMPEALQGRAGDPFQLARRSLAQADLLPQVVLTSVEALSESVMKAKYGSAFSDCLRMLGVLPVEDLPKDLQPAALTVIQRNTDIVAGQQRKGHAFPLAARTKEGQLECALPDETGAPQWAPYAVAVLRILKGDYGKFGRGRQEENLAKFETFFTMAMEDINRIGPSLVICEGETLTHKMSALANGRLIFDHLTIANRTLTPNDLPNLRIVRTSPDPKRQPYYHHDTETSWPSGLFGWGAATRTFYGLKQKPVTVSNAQHYAARVSRHAELEEGVRRPKENLGRVSSQMDEICVAFRQEGDDPLTLATLVHRLRGAHAQYDADTARPFPLHELRKLGGGVTL